MKCAASTLKGKWTTEEAEVICPSFPSGAHPIWDEVSPGLFTPGPNLRTTGNSGMTSRSRGRNRWNRQPFPLFPLPASRCQEIRNPASSGRTPAEGAESLEEACCAWRRLHLDPQLRRRRLVSRPLPTRSPPRPPRRTGASQAALRERRRLPRDGPGSGA